MEFTLLATDTASRARLGELRLAHATVRTPLFMPCASLAVVRACDIHDIRQLGVQMLCCNAYHLWQRPGDEVVRGLGGLHPFMNWPGGILTDSGGFQVFSLARPKDIIEEGVRFRSHLDGSKLMLTPEKSIAIQNNLGSDIAMAFDECAPYPADRGYIERSLERTLRWAQRTSDAHANPNQALFGIVQGGLYPDLRAESARRTVEMGFDGYALGGLSVGESKQQMLQAVEVCEPLLPSDRPRYVMGVGTPADILSCVLRGVDMFDCVLPTRMARHGSLLTAAGTLKIKNARYREDPRPLEEDCDCPACAHHSRAWLHHLFRIQEATAWRLLSLHNIRFYKRFMASIRRAIQDGTLTQLSDTVQSWTRRDAAGPDPSESEPEDQ